MLSLTSSRCFAVGCDIVHAIRAQAQRQMGKLDMMPVFKPGPNDVKKRQLPFPVILREDVEKLGKKGDVVFVKKSFARNNLILNQLAYYATEENLKKYAVLDKDKTENITIKPSLLKKLESMSIVMERPENKVWDIDEHTVASEFRNHGIIVPVHCIDFVDVYPITEFGDYKVQVTINNTESILVKVAVTAWTPKVHKKFTEHFGNQHGLIEQDKVLEVLEGSDHTF